MSRGQYIALVQEEQADMADRSPDALISSASCWSFLDELLAEVSSESLAAILTKIPTLPIFNAFLSRHSALATDEKTCNPARSVLDHILPLAAARATADAVSGSIFLVYQVMVQQTTGCTAWTDLLTCACQHLPVSLALASSAVHKKVYSSKSAYSFVNLLTPFCVLASATILGPAASLAT